MTGMGHSRRFWDVSDRSGLPLTPAAMLHRSAWTRSHTAQERKSWHRPEETAPRFSLFDNYMNQELLSRAMICRCGRRQA